MAHGTSFVAESVITNAAHPVDLVMDRTRNEVSSNTDPLENTGI